MLRSQADSLSRLLNLRIRRRNPRDEWALATRTRKPVEYVKVPFKTLVEQLRQPDHHFCFKVRRVTQFVGGIAEGTSTIEARLVNTEVFESLG